MVIIKILKEHQIVAYLIMTFLFTWIFWGIAFTSISLNGPFRILGSFMPSVMAIIFTSYYDGFIGIKKLLRKLSIWRVNPFFVVFIFLYTSITIYIPSFICSIIGVDYKIYINDHISSFQLNSPSTILICFFAIIIFGGPLGEELGWRGFVLPKLQQKVNPLISSIIIGIIWTSWHIPMFYFHVPGYDISFISYLLETIYLAIIFTWVYNNTKGSLLIIILYHSIDNFIMAICFNAFMESFNIYTALWWGGRLIILVFIIFDMSRKTVKQL